MKAYAITSKFCDIGTIIVWAETHSKAKSYAYYHYDVEGAEYVDLYCHRIPDFDKYADTKAVPVLDLMEHGWYFECPVCHRDIDMDDVEAGTVTIDDDCIHHFVKGRVIHNECKEKENNTEVGS